jgi:hypothetical protein
MICVLGKYKLSSYVHDFSETGFFPSRYAWKVITNKIAFEKNAMPSHGSNFIAVHQRTRN